MQTECLTLTRNRFGPTLSMGVPIARNLRAGKQLPMLEPMAKPSSGLFTIPFCAALLILGAAAVLAVPVNAWMKVKLTKKALPLQQPLAMLDQKALYPYRPKGDPYLLEPAVVEALGTKQYLSWTIEDTSVPENHPLRLANLFITYYSGGPNLVPHTPDVCYLGAGYQPACPHETIDAELATMNDAIRRIPVRVLTFAATALFDQSQISVVYTFGCNGKIAADREAIRALINEPKNTHAYFSKVEVSFHNATREDSIQGAKKLFAVVLPLLIRNHWPDFEAAEQAARVNS